MKGALTHEEQATTTTLHMSKIGHAKSKKDNGIQSAKDDIMDEESITTSERYTKLLIGDLRIFIDKTSEEKNSFDESIYDHSGVPLLLHEECMTSSGDTIKCDSENVPTVENESENSMCDSPLSLDEFEQSL